MAVFGSFSFSLQFSTIRVPAATALKISQYLRKTFNYHFYFTLYFNRPLWTGISDQQINNKFMKHLKKKYSWQNATLKATADESMQWFCENLNCEETFFSK